LNVTSALNNSEQFSARAQRQMGITLISCEEEKKEVNFSSEYYK
jgi:hypothetical protein